MKKRLFILVEGEDDVRFFGRIVKPFFVNSYHSVEIIPFASTKRLKINNFLISVSQMNHDYIFVADIDNERSVRDKKQILYHWFTNINGASIIVVIKEIESWYYAGLPDAVAHRMGVPVLLSTDELTKENFNELIPALFDSRIDFMFEILKSFSPVTAAERNRSFKFFLTRYNLAEPADAPAQP